MNRILFLLILGLFVSDGVAAQPTISDDPLSSRIASYDIKVKLDTTDKTLTGTEILHWKNTSKDTITELQFHMYLNAFKNSMSTFNAESDRIPSAFRSLEEESWGWVEINEISDEQGNDLTASMAYFQPDDQNEYDQTVLKVILTQPIYPGETKDYTINFTSKLPKIVARTGYSKNYYLLAQWFPKIGVYESTGVRYAEKGQWNCHQFHARSEFYADFGVYNVEITVPKSHIVGASGVLQSSNLNADNTKTYIYRAEDVIDFAWTASPQFLVIKDKWKHVDIRLLINPEHNDNSYRFLQSAKESMEYFTKNVGAYPYTSLTMVVPPMHGIRSVGMEYPTFITCLSFAGLPEGIRTPEIITAHELGHQYFMQMIASNEFEEPWLDEGFTTYFENRMMDHYYGEHSATIDMFGYKIGGLENTRSTYTGMSNPKISEVFRPAWGFTHGGYGSLSYHKTGTWLSTLERMIGIETMNQIIKTYFERWKFKHPCANDFIDIVNEVVTQEHGDRFGSTMDWFFDQVLYGTDICDYELHDISNELINKRTGIFEIGTEKEFIKFDEKNPVEADSIYISKVIIHRLGEATYPVDVKIRFENGKEITENWEGLDRTYEFKYTGKHKIESAIIDPEQKILMDMDFNNNSLTKKPEKAAVWKYTAKFLFFIENLMMTISALI